jgi:hypothetical protein
MLEVVRHAHGRIHHGCLFVSFFTIRMLVTDRCDIQLRREFARCTFLALSRISSPISTFPITSVTTSTASSATSPLSIITSHHTSWRCMRTLLLDVCGRHNLGGKVEPFTEVIKPLGGESVVVVLPRELSLEERPGGQGLACFDNLAFESASVKYLENH